MTTTPFTQRYSHDGTCVSCKRKRLVFSIGRQGGGTYRRGGRRYSSSICGQCAVDAMPYCSTHAGATHDGFDVRALVDIVASLARTEFPGAAEAHVEYTVRKDAALVADAERRARS